jgi:serine/threonine protein kinase
MMAEKGPSLYKWIKKAYFKFPLEAVQQIGFKMLKILQEFHQTGYIHGDIKPDNILLGKDQTLDMVASN